MDNKGSKRNRWSWKFRFTMIIDVFEDMLKKRKEKNFQSPDSLGEYVQWRTVRNLGRVKTGWATAQLVRGNSNIFYVHPDPWGRWTQFDDHIFQRGWFNHQPVIDVFEEMFFEKKKDSFLPQTVWFHDPSWFALIFFQMGWNKNTN